MAVTEFTACKKLTNINLVHIKHEQRSAKKREYNILE